MSLQLDPEPELEQLALVCTCDDRCEAPADAHEPDCPVEQKLAEEFGF